MKKYVYIAQSLDGFIAKTDGDLDWLRYDQQDEDYGFKKFMETIDVLIMGANTFGTIMNFEEWYYDKKRVIVLSSSLKMDDIPTSLKTKIEISSLSPKKILSSLEKDNVKGVYIDGGKIIQSFLKEDLIDELIITQIPILLGAGVPLFGNLKKEIKLEHIKTLAFKNGLVQLNYKVLY